MIQRIQSIYLLLSGTSFLSLFKVPFATSATAIPSLLADGVYNIYDNGVLIALAGLGGLLSIVAIFLFNNRMLQLKMSYGSIVLSILLPLVAMLLIYNEGTITNHASQIVDGFGIYMPVVAMIFGFLAARFIQKDEQTVQSMDRLR